jgi:hypothetical protein
MSSEKLMSFQLKLNIGEKEFTITDTALTHQEFFQKAAFWTSLPKEGPNGESDLKLEFRTTAKGHHYYSIVSESAKKELKLGCSLKNPGSLFVKGWDTLIRGQVGAEDHSEEVDTQNVSAFGQARSQVAAPQQQAFSQQPRQPLVNQAFGQVPQQQIPSPTQVVRPAVSLPKIATPSAAPVAQTNIQPNQAALTNVLSKYNLGVNNG